MKSHDIADELGRMGSMTGPRSPRALDRSYPKGEVMPAELAAQAAAGIAQSAAWK